MTDPPRGSPRRALLLLCLLAAVALAAWYFRRAAMEAPAPPQVPPNRLRLVPTAAPLAIPLEEMSELDFLKREQVLALRRGFVQKQPGLVEGTYAPSPAVFGQVVDGRPWWGILGIYFYGSGQQSIEGPSEETRFINNPFLLAGVMETLAWRGSGAHPPPPIHPRPLKLVWFEGGQRRARVTYDARRFFEGLVTYGYPPQSDLNLVVYNARDLGLPYLRVDASRSRNVRQRIPSGPVPMAIPQFIHTGGSCGYPGGCNNMSPHVPALELRVDALPASLWLELWREPAPSPSRAADFAFVLDLQ